MYELTSNIQHLRGNIELIIKLISTVKQQY